MLDHVPWLLFLFVVVVAVVVAVLVSVELWALKLLTVVVEVVVISRPLSLKGPVLEVFCLLCYFACYEGLLHRF